MGENKFRLQTKDIVFKRWANLNTRFYVIQAAKGESQSLILPSQKTNRCARGEKHDSQRIVYGCLFKC